MHGEWSLSHLDLDAVVSLFKFGCVLHETHDKAFTENTSTSHHKIWLCRTTLNHNSRMAKSQNIEKRTEKIHLVHS